MCLSVKLNGKFAVAGPGVIVGAKAFNIAGSRLKACFVDYSYKFRGEFVEQNNSLQSVIFNVETPDGSITKHGTYQTLGYHISPITEWRPRGPNSVLTWALVSFLVSEVQAVGVQDVVVNTFAVTPINVIEKLRLDNLFSIDELIKQQKLVLKYTGHVQ